MRRHLAVKLVVGSYNSNSLKTYADNGYWSMRMADESPIFELTVDDMLVHELAVDGVSLDNSITELRQRLWTMMQNGGLGVLDGQCWLCVVEG